MRGHADLVALDGSVLAEVAVGVDSVDLESVELEGGGVHGLDALVVEVGLEHEAAESAGLGQDNHALRAFDTEEEDIVGGDHSGYVVVGGGVGDSVLLLEDVLTLGSVPCIEVEVSFGVGLVVIAGFPVAPGLPSSPGLPCSPTAL